ERGRGHFAGVGPLTVTHRFATADLPAESWPQDEQVGGGRIVGEACHAIDLAIAITGSLPVRVWAESAGARTPNEITDDRVCITMRHADGALSTVHYDRGASRDLPQERIEVFGGGRAAVIEAWDDVDLYGPTGMTRERGGKDKGHA